ncbi:EscT/YscT/HrcT family type III secretion system export apparatus protein [Rhizobium giardinii]|uniref:Type III secretion protein T n=1 Tax=Rhizobium giardinii TaxID=56731 RepID=A0A7W8X9B1_9HYPH|nr:flagellar biosynthetic protein FliR [Rhizobium giardinii]MBB5536481.1 type III secretion protein T [Rhizobium giardinii]
MEASLSQVPVVTLHTAIPAAAALGAARALGILSIFPLFSLFSITGLLRIGLAIGLSAPAVAFAHTVLVGGQTTYLELGALFVKEFAFGGMIGLGLGIPFWAAQSAGDMTDVYRGANAANLFDQVNALETTPLGSLLMSIALAIFVATGGVTDLVAIFYKSFEIWPLFTLKPAFGSDALGIVLDLFTQLFRIGALLAAPFVIVMGAIELSLGFVGRSAKQFPLNDSVATFKNLAVAAVLVFYAMFAGSYFNEIWMRGFAEVKSLFEVAHVEK